MSWGSAKQGVANRHRERHDQLAQDTVLLDRTAPRRELVMTRVFNQIANQKKKPLVIAFSGPSSHGKTEMAIQIGDMLSAKHTTIDCAQLEHWMDLLGSTSGYNRSKEGSEMNNFIAENSGERAVVFLDEFDKTEEEIRESAGSCG